MNSSEKRKLFYLMMETTKVLASGLIPAMLDKQVEYDQQRHQAKPVQRSSRCPEDPERKM